MRTGIFQIILLLACGFVITIAVLMFSGVIPGFKSQSGVSRGTLVLWGTLPQVNMLNLISSFNKEEDQQYDLRYVQKSPATLEEEFVDALARNEGPDLILLPEHLLISQGDKLYPIPANRLPLRDFRDTYIEVGEIYIMPEGIMALPLTIDPLVMYYNRDLYASAGLPTVPSTWSGLIKNHSALTELGDRGLVVKSGLAFGTANNIARAKDVLAMLILQAGSPIVIRNNTTGDYQSVLHISPKSNSAGSPAGAALDFFTSFANPQTITYSWNESMPVESTAFAAGKLAHYFGYASEADDIRQMNPNLNFDIAVVPQRDNVGRKLTLGRLTGIAIVINTRSLDGAYAAALKLASSAYTRDIALIAKVPSARRDLLAEPTNDLYGDVFYKSAIMSTTWLDPNEKGTKAVFDEMIRQKNIGRTQTSAIINEANQKIDLLIK
ncbi:MAG: extracellular solute-binding protein [Patescibacteria group bacterium]